MLALTPFFAFKFNTTQTQKIEKKTLKVYGDILFTAVV